jgi:hypothetical protein
MAKWRIKQMKKKIKCIMLRDYYHNFNKLDIKKGQEVKIRSNYPTPENTVNVEYIPYGSKNKCAIVRSVYMDDIKVIR